MYCIRRTSIVVFSISLVVLVSCKKNEVEEFFQPLPDNIPMVTGSLASFTVYPLGGLDPSVTQADGPINIEEGDQLVFTNTSVFTRDDTSTIPATVISWTFEGGDPPESIANSNVRVLYETEGEYNVTLEIEGTGGRVEVYSQYVKVWPRGTIKRCLLLSQVSDDGRTTRYQYDGLRRLGRIDNLLNNDLQEYSTFNYDTPGTIEQTFKASDELTLGQDYYQISIEEVIESHRREDASGNPLFEYTFNNHPNGYAESAQLTVWDGYGGQSVTDITYTYNDDYTAVVEEIYEINGTVVGSVGWTWDDMPSKYSGFIFPEYAKRQSAYNPTSKTQYDGSGAVISTETYGFTYDQNFCYNPVGSIRDLDGQTTNTEYEWGTWFFF